MKQNCIWCIKRKVKEFDRNKLNNFIKYTKYI